MKRYYLFLSLLTIFSLNSFSSTNGEATKMQWFKDARLGIFIHWGIYAVNGVTESWSFHNKEIPLEEYMAQQKGFTAINYNPKEWVDLIKNSGAKYAVITSKHHDGITLWDTKTKTPTVKSNTPAKKDVLTPFVDVLREVGIKLGIYFSLIDWPHKDYPEIYRDGPKKYDLTKEPRKWSRFCEYNTTQLKELIGAYNPDLWWFDGDWEHSATEWQSEKIRKMILESNSKAIINGRLAGYGDYATPEQNFPITRPKEEYWELCMTINSSWGFQHKDSAWKTPNEVISIYVETISNGGNLLLDIGPREDGSIPSEAKNVLRKLGEFNNLYKEAIFETEGALPMGHFHGNSMLSKDSTSIYLFVPKGQREFVLKGLNSKIVSASVMDSSLAEVSYKEVGKISWSPNPGIIFFNVTEEQDNTSFPFYVVKIKLDNKIHLYRGNGGLGTI